MNVDSIYRELKCGYPFVYKLEPNTFCYIGAAVYRRCTPDEIALFEEYYNEITALHNLRYTPENRDVKKLVDLLDDIMDRGDVEYSSETAGLTKHELWADLQKLNEDSLRFLVQQRNLFTEALDYKDGAFYRHSKDKTP